jgi:Tripartite tricarboxylate transporter family receptor
VRTQWKWSRFELFCLLAIPVWVGSSAALSQTYPATPVKFITPQAAGSGTNPAMSVLIDRLGTMWGQQTVLIDEPGAGGALAARTAAAAAPDGYTLFMAIASTFTVLPESQPNLPFDVNGFVPIGFIGEVPMGIAVSPELPVNSLSELIALSKRQRGGLNVALGLHGGIPHLTTELLRARSGADLTAQATCHRITCRSGVPPRGADSLRNRAGIGRVWLVCPGCTPRHSGLDCEKSGRRPARRPQSGRHHRKIRRALPLDAFDVAPGACHFIHSEQQLWKPIIMQIGSTPQ